MFQFLSGLGLGAAVEQRQARAWNLRGAAVPALGVLGNHGGHGVQVDLQRFVRSPELLSERLGYPSGGRLATGAWRWSPSSLLNIWEGLPSSRWCCNWPACRASLTELFDAAKVDGAGGFATLRYITLPLMKIVIVANIILITVYTFNIFDLVYAMTGGGPINATELIGIFMYRAAFISGRLGYGAVHRVGLCSCSIY